MHKYFAEWYRAAGLEPKAEDLEKRWQAVEGFAKEIKLHNALELVRLFYARSPQSVDFAESYIGAFQKADPTFPMRDNAVELRVLSGATVAHIFETTRTTVTDAVALAMVSGFCRGLRQKILNSEIVDSARVYLMKEAVRVRDVDESFDIKTPDTDLEGLLEALTSAATGNNLTTIREPIKPPFDKLAQAISNLSLSVSEMAGRIEEVIKIRREQAEILWWVFGEHSRDLSKPISELPLPFAALVSGKELADLVRVIPGPLASPAFLEKMLGFADPDSSGSASIKDAVNAAPRDWRESLIADTCDLEDLCPIHLAVQKSLEFNKPNVWPTHFDKHSELKSRTAIAALDLATQIYDERMLINAVRDANAS